MLLRIVLLIFAISDCFILLNAKNLRIDLPVGPVIGRERVTATGFTYYSYQGIPFAEPPVGRLRFQAPVEKQPWKDVLDATQERNCCYQMYMERPDENEDCLFINVYTPAEPSSNKSLPVMFWIYGGGFLNGMATELSCGADHLVAKDIVIVEANYRIGPFGFFSTGDEIIPGNAGLKDQNFALRWTNEYIKYFGGDPERITIFGQSAGAASVSYHLLSPLSKGLFQAAILESGSSLNPWAYNRYQTRISYDLAKIVNPEAFPKHNSSSKALLEYMLSLSADQIDNASLKLDYPKYNQVQYGFFFAPVIEVEHPGAFLTKKQYEQFDLGAYNRVPVMMGFNSEEQLAMLNDNGTKEFAGELEADRQLLVPLDMNEKVENRQKIADLIHEQYSPNSSFIDNPRNLVKYMSDHGFVRAVYKQARLQSKHGKVWLYRFAYKGTMSGGSDVPVHGFSPDVIHGEELFYVFAYKYNGRNTTDASLYPKEDILVHNRMVTMWSNFAKYHNPTPIEDTVLQNITWPVFSTSEEEFLDIGSEMAVKNYPNKKTMAFWETLYHTYGIPPYDSY